jgi:hypothetical protein
LGSGLEVAQRLLDPREVVGVRATAVRVAVAELFELLADALQVRWGGSSGLNRSHWSSIRANRSAVSA